MPPRAPGAGPSSFPLGPLTGGVGGLPLPTWPPLTATGARGPGDRAGQRGTRRPLGCDMGGLHLGPHVIATGPARPSGSSRPGGPKSNIPWPPLGPRRRGLGTSPWPGHTAWVPSVLAGCRGTWRGRGTVVTAWKAAVPPGVAAQSSVQGAWTCATGILGRGLFTSQWGRGFKGSSPGRPQPSRGTAASTSHRPGPSVFQAQSGVPSPRGGGAGKVGFTPLKAEAPRLPGLRLPGARSLVCVTHGPFLALRTHSASSTNVHFAT